MLCNLLANFYLAVHTILSSYTSIEYLELWLCIDAALPESSRLRLLHTE